MAYPKVKDFLMHVVTGTNILILDDIKEDFTHFEGVVGDYIESSVSSENLTLLQSSIRDNTLIIRAVDNYESFK